MLVLCVSQHVGLMCVRATGVSLTGLVLIRQTKRMRYVASEKGLESSQQNSNGCPSYLQYSKEVQMVVIRNWCGLQYVQNFVLGLIFVEYYVTVGRWVTNILSIYIGYDL